MRPAAKPRRKLFDRLNSAFREPTDGLKLTDLVRRFERETQTAYSVLNRSQAAEQREPTDEFERFLYRARVLFFGFYQHLGTTRRVAFLLSLLFAVFGLFDWGFAFNFSGRLVFDSSPLWFVLSIIGLLLVISLSVVDQVRVRDELEIAQELQRDLLPKISPLLDGWTIVHTYEPANEVGGDYYDFHRLPDGRLAVMVGDASGHGIAAGLLMATANATLKLAIDLDPDPVKVLELLNRALCNTSDRRAFMSLWYGVLDLTTGQIEFASAGHPFPYLRRKSGALEELGSGGLPLGVRKSIRLTRASAVLAEGDLMVLYSDGLPEATDAQDRAFSYERLAELVHGTDTPHKVHDLLLNRLRSHLGEAPLQDDFSLVVVGRNAPLPPLPIPAVSEAPAANAAATGPATDEE